MPIDVLSQLTSVWTEVKVPFHTFLGALTLYILNRLQGKRPFSLFQALNIDVADATARSTTIFFDMILSSALGTIVVIPLTSPSTVPQALIAGLGMTGILAAHSKEAPKA